MEGEKVTIIFDDGKKPSRKEGTITSITPFSIAIEQDDGVTIDVIPKNRIYRIRYKYRQKE